MSRIIVSEWGFGPGRVTDNCFRAYPCEARPETIIRDKARPATIIRDKARPETIICDEARSETIIRDEARS